MKCNNTDQDIDKNKCYLQFGNLDPLNPHISVQGAYLNLGEDGGHLFEGDA